jgi:hypothetical protein
MFVRDSTIIVDFQFNIGSLGENIVKEIGILHLNSTKPDHYLIKPPFEFKQLPYKYQRQNKYNCDVINKLPWNCGTEEYTKITFCLDKDVLNASIILVKGRAKKEILARMFPFAKIENLDNVMPALKDLPNYQHHCSHHEADYSNCVLNNVFKIRSYVERMM